MVHLGTYLSARLIAQPLHDPIQPEVIAIGYRGIAPWLTREITQSVGVGANLHYPFQSRAITDALRGLYRLAVAPNLSPDNPWTANTMTWAIADLLPHYQNDPCFAPLHRFLEDDGGSTEQIGHRRISLSTQIANIFDRYLMYRPDWTLAWGKDQPAPRLSLPEDARWQPILWRALTKRFGEGCPHLAEMLAALQPELLTALDPEPIREALALHRLSVFGLNSIPKTLLLALEALSHVVDIDLYVFSPSDTYWADIRKGEALRREFQFDHEGYSQAFSERHEQAHPLLLSLGRSARDFQHLLLEQMDQGLEDYTREEAFIHSQPQSESLLHRLQADLQRVLLRQERSPIAPNDNSFQVHACHGPARQVEVLKESLLHLLNRDPTLEPRDILILCPDLDAYAPLLSSVFDEGAARHDTEAGWGHDGVPSLEYRFADLTMRRLNPVAEALMRVLDLAQSRLGIDDVMGLLSLDAIQRRFGFQPSDLEDLQQIFELGKIRWGMDAAHRAREGQPKVRAFTWEEGLTQIALGAAMSDEGSDFHSETFYAKPMDSIEGERLELAGKCLHFSTNLFATLQALQAPATLSTWATRIVNLLDWLTETPEQAEFLKRRALDVIKELEDAARLAGSSNETPLTLEAIQSLLRGRFDVAHSSGRASLHAIQCSNFQSLRGVPARVVALLGMDDGSFPHQSVRSSMDLTNAPRWIGDSDPREEERGALLDAILAARDHLLIFYTGRDKQTHEELEPAAPIREVLDAIDLSFTPSQSDILASQSVTKVHALHRFATSNYQESKPWSFSQRGLEASRVFHGAAFKTRAPMGLVGHASMRPTPPSRDLSGAELKSWLLKPQRMYASSVLRIKPFDARTAATSREPINLSAYEYADLSSELVGSDSLLLGEPLAELDRHDKRAFSLPLGAPGQLLFEGLEAKLELAYARYAELIESQSRVTIPPGTWHTVVSGEAFTLNCPGFTYDQTESESYLATFSSGYNNDAFRLEHWLIHLMAVVQTEGILEATRATLVTQGSEDPVHLRVEIPGDTAKKRLHYAETELNKLLALTDQARKEPLPIFRKTSYAAMKKLHEVQSGEGLTPTDTFTASDFTPEAIQKAAAAATSTWGELDKSFGFSPECQDATLKALYRGTRPFLSAERPGDFDDAFFETSLQLWLPILTHTREEDAQ